MTFLYSLVRHSPLVSLTESQSYISLIILGRFMKGSSSFFQALSAVSCWTLLSCGEKSEKHESLVVISTTEISQITDSSASGGGNISTESVSEVIARGICWDTAPYPTVEDDKTSDGAGIGDFVSVITGLEPSTNYYVRAYAININGTYYGNQVSFLTDTTDTGQGSNTVTDIDGNIYHTVTIGTQVWMIENLKVTRYQNGDTIIHASDSASWENLGLTGGFCYYDNDTTLANTYGNLYNWFAVHDRRGVAPEGWRVPTDADWTVLTDYLGGLEIAGGKLKENGTSHWQSPNSGATNETGFRALPGGYRKSVFEGLGSVGYWWTSTPTTQNLPTRSFSRSMAYNDSFVSRFSNFHEQAMSIRCIKN